jgi:hypothetical protein
MHTLFDYNTIEVVIKRYENAFHLVTQTIDRIMVGEDDITQGDLVIF